MCNACWETGAQGQCPFMLASFAANTGYNYFKQCNQQNMLLIWLNQCGITASKQTNYDLYLKLVRGKKKQWALLVTNLFSSSSFSRSGTDCGSDHCLPICSIDQGRSLLHDWYILRLPLRRDVPPFNASASDKMCSTGARWTRGVETFALPNQRLRLGVPERGGRCLVRRDARRGSFPVKATGSCHAITLDELCLWWPPWSCPPTFVSEYNLFGHYFVPLSASRWRQINVFMSEPLNHLGYSLRLKITISKLCYPL